MRDFGSGVKIVELDWAGVAERGVPPGLAQPVPERPGRVLAPALRGKIVPGSGRRCQVAICGASITRSVWMWSAIGQPTTRPADLFDDDLDEVANALDAQAAKSGVVEMSSNGDPAALTGQQKPPASARDPGVLYSAVAPTGIDPVTFRFSVERCATFVLAKGTNGKVCCAYVGTTWHQLEGAGIHQPDTPNSEGPRGQPGAFASNQIGAGRHDAVYASRPQKNHAHRCP